MALSWSYPGNLVNLRTCVRGCRLMRPSPGRRRSPALLPAMALVTLSIVVMTSSVRAQALPSIVIVSGNNQTGVINTPLPSPLVVRVESGSTRVGQALVTWQVVSGSGTLSSGTATFTDSNGLASNALTLGSAQGPISVSATLSSGGQSVSFNVNNPTPDAAISGLKQFAQLGNLALTTATVQTTNIGLRLAALRRGASGISIEGLSLQGDGERVPLTLLASLITVAGGGGGQSAERPTVSRRVGIFLNGQGSFGDQTATGGEPGLKFHTTGGTMGLDYRFTDRFVLGTAFGYVSTQADFDASAGDFSARAFSASVFGSYYLAEKFYIDTIATYGWHDYDTRRNVGLLGVPVVARGDTDGTQFALSVSGGYSFNVGALTFGPTGRVTYIHLDIDGFSEKDGGIFNLNVGSQSIRSVTTGLGAQLSYAISMPWGVLVPRVHGEWEHEFKGDSRLLTGTLVADPLQTTFAVQTNDPDRDYARAGIDITATLKAGMAAFVAYESVVGRNQFTHHGLNAGVRLEF